MKGGICEDNDMCAGRWNKPQRHVIDRRLGGGECGTKNDACGVRVMIMVMSWVGTMVTPSSE